jgi:hypothetical protein
MYYCRTAYQGKHTADGKRMHGHGVFTMANGDQYVGTFHDGAFHGNGVVFFTAANGGGQFRGTWNQGKLVSGEYIHGDGLRYQEKGWTHCTEADRRYWNEVLKFIAPPTVSVGGASSSSSSSALMTKTPDYSVTDGIPPAFADGQPRNASDVTDAFWQQAPDPKPEFGGPVALEGLKPMAAVIAQSCPRK